MKVSFPSAQPSLLARYSHLPSPNIPYVIIGMFTASYAQITQRLVNSLQHLGLPHLLFEVPTVHRSISPKGTPDSIYTKPNFIFHVSQLLGCPVLYVDTDVVFRSTPHLIETLVSEKFDFGILNWLALDRNDTYKPVPVQVPPSEPQPKSRFFHTSHQIQFHSREQMVCSGAVQYWGRSERALSLLTAWHEAIGEHPFVQDDHCLDFAFNNLPRIPETFPRTVWLPKAYARYAWWIFDEPVIDHPEFPYAGGEWAELEDPAGRKRIYPERLSPRDPVWEFPESCILDSMTGVCYQREDQQLIPIGTLEKPLWIV